MISCGFTAQWLRDVGRNGTLSPVLFKSGSCRWNLWTHENESFPALAGIQAEFGQTLCKLPCTSPGADLLQDEWGPWASLLAQPIPAAPTSPSLTVDECLGCPSSWLCLLPSLSPSRGGGIAPSSRAASNLIYIRLAISVLGTPKLPD